MSTSAPSSPSLAGPSLAGPSLAGPSLVGSQLSHWLVDTHCHLDHPKLPGTADEAVAQAEAAGVGVLINIESGHTLEDNARAVATAERFAHVYAVIGVHPHDAAAQDLASVDGIRQLAQHPKVVAIGEAGLDYHYNWSPREVQREAFATWIALSRELHLPLVVHTRSAERDTLDVLAAEPLGERAGVIHCFTGTAEFARAALDLGFYISIPGVITFKNPGELPEVARFVPSDRLLVETDSPYLAPIPFRGRPNQPAYVLHTAQVVAALRGESLDSLAEATTANAQRLFGIASRSDAPAPRE